MSGLAHDGQKRMKEMKKLNVVLALMVVAVFALLSLGSQKAYADTVVSLTLTGNYSTYTWFSDNNDPNPNTANGSYSESVGPYSAILNGGPYNNTLVQVICYDMNLATQIGTTYQGSIEPLSSFYNPTYTEIMEATYLDNMLMNDGGQNADLNTRGAISTAIWQIMEPTSAYQIAN